MPLDLVLPRAGVIATPNTYAVALLRLEHTISGAARGSLERKRSKDSFNNGVVPITANTCMHKNMVSTMMLPLKMMLPLRKHSYQLMYRFNTDDVS